MGKTKQTGAKKFDRNVEISAPILDPEMIRAIHSPLKDKKRDIRHGGFKALLSDLNSQDSTDELVAINENHLPSYIGISCAVSGYSNYSSYNRRPVEETSGATDTRGARLTTSSNGPKATSATPNRSHTNSPTSRRNEHQHINHVTIDKSTISSADQERKELTEKLTASATERRRSPSPLPPLEDGRHHGAYVGARYFPMPEPSKLVHKHIPLLGIDDDQDPDEFVADDLNKVEKRIADLYGEEFVEDWKQSMSHKSKTDLHEEKEKAARQELAKAAAKNPKDLVNLKPVPPKSREQTAELTVDVPTPDAKVLAGVEKQFLNKLLTDDNPPTPRSPSPRLMSPVSPRYSRPVVSPSASIPTQQANRDSLDSPLASPSPVSFGSPAPSSPQPQKLATPKKTPQASPEPLVDLSSPVVPMVTANVEAKDDVVEDRQAAAELISAATGQASDSPRRDEPQESLLVGIDQPRKDESTTLDEQPRAQSSEQISEESPASSRASSAIEVSQEQGEQHIEYEIRATSPVDNESSPVKELVNIETPRPNQGAQEAADLVTFSPEPAERILSEDYKDNHNGALEAANQIDLTKAGDVCETLPEAQSEAQQLPSETAEVASSKSVAGAQEGPINDGKYFLSVLDGEKSFIMDQVKLAEAALNEHESDWDEEKIGKVRSAIGKANLLINKKCNQFRQLCEQSLVNDASDQYAVLNDDLAGFWDMISIQIADVKKSFEDL